MEVLTIDDFKLSLHVGGGVQHTNGTFVSSVIVNVFNASKHVWDFVSVGSAWFPRAWASMSLEQMEADEAMQKMVMWNFSTEFNVLPGVTVPAPAGVIPPEPANVGWRTPAQIVIRPKGHDAQTFPFGAPVGHQDLAVSRRSSSLPVHIAYNLGISTPCTLSR